jgi:SpoVK/Ycf46/Vps4 family AAA+-type ATPase
MMDNEIVKNVELINKLPGLLKVKKEVKSIVDFLLTSKEREKEGLGNLTTITNHLIFTGNPGTGKTTVARIIANIYRDLGLISGGKLIEVTRSDLVVSEKGETAKRSAERYNNAIDNVLFIDEAYTLINKNDPNDNGQEAIDELLKFMEDYRDRIIVVVAGYEKEMSVFIDSNAGLASRFKKKILFEDYNFLDLYQIFYKFCKDNNYAVSNDANESLRNACKKVIKVTGEKYSNGRDIRRFFESCIETQASRLTEKENKSKADLMMIKKRDIETAISNFN